MSDTNDLPLSVPAAIEHRRSVRHFEPDPIPDDVLQQLVELSVMAPTSWNLQPVRMVVVRDDEGLTAESSSQGSFTIHGVDHRTYDFSSGGGLDKWGWGHKVTSWNNVGGFNPPNGVDVPITDIDSDVYARLAASDATGGTSDTGRYRSPTPESSSLAGTSPPEIAQ